MYASGIYGTYMPEGKREVRSYDCAQKVSQYHTKENILSPCAVVDFSTVTFMQYWNIFKSQFKKEPFRLFSRAQMNTALREEWNIYKNEME